MREETSSMLPLGYSQKTSVLCIRLHPIRAAYSMACRRYGFDIAALQVA